MGAVPRGWASVPRLLGSLAPQLHWDFALVQMVHLQSLMRVRSSFVWRDSKTCFQGPQRPWLCSHCHVCFENMKSAESQFQSSDSQHIAKCHHSASVLMASASASEILHKLTAFPFYIILL